MGARNRHLAQPCAVALTFPRVTMVPVYGTPLWGHLMRAWLRAIWVKPPQPRVPHKVHHVNMGPKQRFVIQLVVHRHPVLCNAPKFIFLGLYFLLQIEPCPIGHLRIVPTPNQPHPSAPQSSADGRFRFAHAHIRFQHLHQLI